MRQTSLLDSFVKRQGNPKKEEPKTDEKPNAKTKKSKLTLDSDDEEDYIEIQKKQADSRMKDK